MIVWILVIIGVITFFGYCVIASSDDLSDEEQRREDEEQLEWLRKQREKNEHRKT